jgi:hypothetical protein
LHSTGPDLRSQDFKSRYQSICGPGDFFYKQCPATRKRGEKKRVDVRRGEREDQREESLDCELWKWICSRRGGKREKRLHMFTIIIWCYSVLNFGTTSCVSSENLVRGYVFMDLILIAVV